VGERVVRAVLTDRRPGRGAEPVTPAPAMAVADRSVVQRAMSTCAGIGRDGAGLAAASDAVEMATALAVPVDRTGVEDAALTLLAQAVLAAAGTRRESRGCHVRTDFPDRDDRWQAESLRIDSGTWEVCEDINYGKCRTVNRDMSSLDSLGLAKRVSSVRPSSNGGGGRKKSESRSQNAEF